MILRPLLGEWPLRWQVFNLINRWLMGMAVWWSIRKIWPRRKEEAAWLALVFLLYPGFGQQHIAVNSSRHMLPLALLIFSFGVTALSVRQRRRALLLTILALLLTVISMLTTDYYYGLEILRPVFIWIALENSTRGVSERALKTIRRWSPYLFASIAILVWRFFLIEQVYYGVRIPGLDSPEGRSQFLNRLADIPHDLFEVGITAWARTLQLANPVEIGTRSIFLYWGVIVVTALVTTIYFLRLYRRGEATRGQPHAYAPDWSRTAILLGLVAMLAGGLPSWATGLDIGLSFPKDRLTLPMMLGASFLLTGVLRMIRPRFLAVGMLALILALAAGKHVQNAVDFRRDWDRQKAFIWQLVWRIPELDPGTVLLTHRLPFKFETDNSVSAPINWIYAPENKSDRMSYILYDVQTRIGLEFPDLREGHLISDEYRTFARNRSFSFQGSTSQALVIFHGFPACLRVIQPAYDGLTTGLSSQVSKAFDLSKPELINLAPPRPAQPPEWIFGPEPAPGWCYYYQTADLARQAGDWRRVAELGDKALELPGSAGHASEYVLFIEAFGRMREWEIAENLTRVVIDRDIALDRMLCSAWDRVEEAVSPTADETLTITRIRGDLSCSDD
jgi:hypothetical protein